MLKIIKTPKRRHWYHSFVFIVNFEYISHHFLVFLLLTLNKKMLTANRVMSSDRCLLGSSSNYFSAGFCQAQPFAGFFFKIGVLKNSWKHLCRSLFLRYLYVSSLSFLIKKETPEQLYFSEVCKFLKNTFFINPPSHNCFIMWFTLKVSIIWEPSSFTSKCPNKLIHGFTCNCKLWETTAT